MFLAVILVEWIWSSVYGNLAAKNIFSLMAASLSKFLLKQQTLQSSASLARPAACLVGYMFCLCFFSFFLLVVQLLA